MKKILTYISIVSAGLFISTNTATAKKYSPGHNSSYVSGHYKCGTPIFTKKIFSHYDRFGRAVFRYLRITPKLRAHTPRKRIAYTNITKQR